MTDCVRQTCRGDLKGLLWRIAGLNFKVQASTLWSDAGGYGRNVSSLSVYCK